MLSDIIYGPKGAQVPFSPNFSFLSQLLKISDIGGEKAVSNIIHDLRGAQVSFTPIFSLLTQLLKILEFHHVDLNLTFFEN